MRRNILILYHEGICFATKLKPTLLPAQPEDYIHKKLAPVNSGVSFFGSEDVIRTHDLPGMNRLL